MSRSTIIVDDTNLGRVATGVLLHCLKSALQDRAEVRTASELNLALPKWRVKPEVARRLNARLAALDGRIAGERLIYLDGNHVLSGDAAAQLLAAAAVAALIAEPAETLRRQRLFALRRSGADRPSAVDWAALQHAEFDEVAETRLSGAAAWPDALQPRVMQPLAVPPPLIDCWKLADRPWLNAAAATPLWSDHLLAATAAGVIKPEDFEADVADGRLRPSAAYQAATRCKNPLALPSTLADLDDEAAPEPLRNPVERRRLVARRIYAAPRVPGKGKSLRRIFWKSWKRTRTSVSRARNALKQLVRL